MAEKIISQAIKKADVELRRKYPILNYQDTLGGFIFISSFIGIFAMCAVYFRHSDSYLVCALCIVINALCISLLHELEHDLIHNLYFRKSTAIQDFMFLCIWIAKLHGNPWYRRELHLKHHIVSGQLEDAEERLIGLGLPFGMERMAVTMHPFGSLIVTPAVAKEAKWLDVRRLNLSSAPVAFLFFGLNKLWMLYVLVIWAVGYDHYSSYLPARHWWWIRAASVLFCLPNMLRQACLVLMSNCSHYYGDIPEKSVFYQNQILDHWVLYPFQLFCFNFGAIHIVHHYVPGQPFYLRQLVYMGVKQLMVDNGVRINDFGIVRRGNRYFDESPIDSTSTDDTTKAAESKGKIISNRKISPNNSGLFDMLLWAGLCFSVGATSYGIFDQWVTVSLARRIIGKYILKRIKQA